ncbi:MAG: DEAD/DEAH box helicase [Nanoarchaeota archaeon]
MLRDIQPRLYQETIFHEASLHNCLVVLPTGMGKTLIALMLAAQRLKQYPNSKVVMLAPTRPLAQQHLDSFKRHLDLPAEGLVLFTGLIDAERRAALWKDTKIVVATPQGIENDLINGKITLEQVSLLVIDEAHRAVKDYSYVWIADQYHKRANYPRILGMTASPGSDVETINEVCKNLFIESIEIRTEDDPDVAPYIQEVKISWVHVELPPSFQAIQRHLKDCVADKVKDIKATGAVEGKLFADMSRREILGFQAELQAELAQGNRGFDVLRALSLAAEIMKVQHALELIESQGITSLNQYLQRIVNDSVTSKVKAVQNLVRDPNFKAAALKAQELAALGIQHPKLEALKRIVKEELKPGMKMLIFNQYRDSAKKIEDELKGIPGVRASVFVGQMKKGDSGMSQKRQLELVGQFRSGGINVLISTAVGEEGLDIPQVDIVVFYEPIPSAIRAIQRRGRTGRTEAGRVIMLSTKGTRDEAYKWSAHHKEERMFRTLKDLKGRITLVAKRHASLDRFMDKVKVIADHREKASQAIKELIDLNASIELQQLESADFQLSRRVGVEVKKVADFVDSIIDGRLLEQIRLLRQNYERPLVIIEGTEDLFAQRNIHPNAIRGMLSTIVVSYGVPLLSTRNAQETAALLFIIARREQDKEPADFTPHAMKPTRTLREQQEYIVSAFPGIGMTLAKPLLGHFKSIRNLVAAPESELKDVAMVGEKKAKAIREVLDRDYEPGT